MLWKNPSIYNCFYHPDCDAVTRKAFILLEPVFGESVLPGTHFGLGLYVFVSAPLFSFS